MLKNIRRGSRFCENDNFCCGHVEFQVTLRDAGKMAKDQLMYDTGLEDRRQDQAEDRNSTVTSIHGT